jgi:hypothetical protein
LSSLISGLAIKAVDPEDVRWLQKDKWRATMAIHKFRELN